MGEFNCCPSEGVRCITVGLAVILRGDGRLFVGTDPLCLGKWHRVHALFVAAVKTGFFFVEPPSGSKDEF